MQDINLNSKIKLIDYENKEDFDLQKVYTTEDIILKPYEFLKYHTNFYIVPSEKFKDFDSLVFIRGNHILTNQDKVIIDSGCFALNDEIVLFFNNKLNKEIYIPKNTYIAKAFYVVSIINTKIQMMLEMFNNPLNRDYYYDYNDILIKEKIKNKIKQIEYSESIENGKYITIYLNDIDK